MPGKTPFISSGRDQSLVKLYEMGFEPNCPFTEKPLLYQSCVLLLSLRIPSISHEYTVLVTPIICNGYTREETTVGQWVGLIKNNFWSPVARKYIKSRFKIDRQTDRHFV